MRYRYKGKDISKGRANLMVIGAMLGMMGAAVGLWLTATLFIALLK